MLLDIRLFPNKRRTPLCLDKRLVQIDVFTKATLNADLRKRGIGIEQKALCLFDFHIGDVELNGTVKFIWYEFRCTGCSNQFTEQKMREFEKAAKATAKAAAKQAKAEAKAANKK